MDLQLGEETVLGHLGSNCSLRVGGAPITLPLPQPSCTAREAPSPRLTKPLPSPSSSRWEASSRGLLGLDGVGRRHDDSSDACACPILIAVACHLVLLLLCDLVTRCAVSSCRRVTAAIGNCRTSDWPEDACRTKHTQTAVGTAREEARPWGRREGAVPTDRDLGDCVPHDFGPLSSSQQGHLDEAFR